MTRPSILAALVLSAVAVALGGAAGPAAAALDPMLQDQWPLSDPSAIGAPEAWTQSLGAGVVVAVLDSGIQANHPDLVGSLWLNPGEVPANRIDDDRNGFVDDVNGANMIGASGDVDDDEGHGTHVAGIIAARAGNGTGGAGLAPSARLMAVKVLDANRAGNSSLLAHGIRYAVDEGARILNVSLNGDATTSELDDALRYAGERGATVVASAGNNSRDIDLSPSFPAASADPAVLSVTASDQGGGLLDFANRGLRSVDLAAPGEGILSTARGSRYESRAGTSMAAPYVAGTLALLSAARPDMSQADLRRAVLASAPRPLGLLNLLASGSLNAAAAMHRILPGSMWRAAAVVPAAAITLRPRIAAPAIGLGLRLRTGPAVRAGAKATLRWSASGADSVIRWRISLDGRHLVTRDSGWPRIVRRRVARAGSHRWKVVGIDARGARAVTAARSFRVLRRR